MRGKVLRRIDFGRVRVRHARRKDMPHARKAPNFRHPDAVQFGIGGKAVVVVVRKLTVTIVLRVEACTALPVLARILRVYPRLSGPEPAPGGPRGKVNHVEQ